MSTTTPPLRRRAVPTILILSAGLTAAFNLVLTEVLLTTLAVDPLLIAVFGNLVGSSILLYARRRRRPSLALLRQPRLIGNILVAALSTYSFAYLIGFLAIRQIGAGKVALFTQLETPFVMLLAVLLLGDRLTWRRSIAALLALLGAGIIAVEPGALRISWQVGEIQAVMAPFFFALGIVAMKPLLDQMDAGWMTGMLLLLGTLFLALLSPALVTSWSLAPSVLFWIAVTGSLRGLVWLQFNMGVKQMGPSRGSILYLSHSFFAVAVQFSLAELFPGLNLQIPGNLLLSLLGGFLIAGGIIVMQSEQMRRRSRAAG